MLTTPNGTDNGATCLIRNVREVGMVASCKNVREVKGHHVQRFSLAYHSHPAATDRFPFIVNAIPTLVKDCPRTVNNKD